MPVGSLGKSGRLGRLGENADDVPDLGRLSGRADKLAQLSARYGNDIVEVRTPERPIFRRSKPQLRGRVHRRRLGDGDPAGRVCHLPGRERRRHLNSADILRRTGFARVSNEELARVLNELEELLESCGETDRVDWVRERREELESDSANARAP